MTKTIRQQLLAKGFKETPRAVVMRKWDEIQTIRCMLAPNYDLLVDRTRLAKQEVTLMSEIDKICTERNIGNPVKGEPIEYKQQTPSIKERHAHAK